MASPQSVSANLLSLRVIEATEKALWGVTDDPYSEAAYSALSALDASTRGRLFTHLTRIVEKYRALPAESRAAYEKGLVSGLVPAKATRPALLSTPNRPQVVAAPRLAQADVHLVAVELPQVYPLMAPKVHVTGASMRGKQSLHPGDSFDILGNFQGPPLGGVRQPQRWFVRLRPVLDAGDKAWVAAPNLPSLVLPVNTPPMTLQQGPKASWNTDSTFHATIPGNNPKIAAILQSCWKQGITNFQVEVELHHLDGKTYSSAPDASPDIIVITPAPPQKPPTPLIRFKSGEDGRRPGDKLSIYADRAASDLPTLKFIDDIWPGYPRVNALGEFEQEPLGGYRGVLVLMEGQDSENSGYRVEMVCPVLPNGEEIDVVLPISFPPGSYEFSVRTSRSNLSGSARSDYSASLNYEVVPHCFKVHIERLHCDYVTEDFSASGHAYDDEIAISSDVIHDQIVKSKTSGIFLGVSNNEDVPVPTADRERWRGKISTGLLAGFQVVETDAGSVDDIRAAHQIVTRIAVAIAQIWGYGWVAEIGQAFHGFLLEKLFAGEDVVVLGDHLAYDVTQLQVATNNTPGFVVRREFVGTGGNSRYRLYVQVLRLGKDDCKEDHR